MMGKMPTKFEVKWIGTSRKNWGGGNFKVIQQT